MNTLMFGNLIDLENSMPFGENSPPSPEQLLTRRMVTTNENQNVSVEILDSELSIVCEPKIKIQHTTSGDTKREREKRFAC